MKALVAEDDPDIQIILKMVLTRMGKCEVSLTDRGEEVLIRAKTERPDFILLDVRDPHEWEISDIDAATHHIPKGQILEHLGELDTTHEIVVYCKTGARSASVVNTLRQHGYTRLKNMSGGINTWAREIDKSLPTY